MNNYYYYEKGTYYFRKAIPEKYLRDKSHRYNFRLSLKKAAKDFYVILERNEKELSNLTNYINKRLDIILAHKKGELVVEDIISYVYKICEEYKNNAIIENSSLEMKRIEALTYTNENGIQQGYSIQAISRKYKQIVDQYDNLDNNPEKTFELGNEILKRSQITREQLMEIKPDQMLIFHEMLIKAEKAILENDIKLYISRNFSQFASLVLNPTESLEQKIEQAYYEYLELIRENDLQADYIKFIKSKKAVPVATKQTEHTIESILAELKKQDKEAAKQVAADIEILIQKFLDYKGYKEKKRNECYRSIQLLKSFMLGNGANFKPKDLTDLTSDDFVALEELLINLPPITKAEKFQNKSIFELVDLRKRENLAKMAVNTLDMKENHIKQFWKYLCKHHKNLGLDLDLKDLLSCALKSKHDKYLNNEEDPLLRAFTQMEINSFIENAYEETKLKRTLLNSPRNFYLFVLSYLCGLRQEEGLLISMKDIKVYEKNGKRYFYFYLNENEKYQHLKNPNSHRNIPITDLMIDLGLLNYIDIRHKKGAETLFDFPKTGGTAARTFFSRAFKELFPNVVDTRANRDSRLLDNYVQFRSFRKNFSEKLFSQNRNEFDTPQNKNRLIGHDNAIESVYLGRGNPMELYHVLNDINYGEINFVDVKDTIKDYFKGIKTDLPWLKEGDHEEWKLVSRVKPKSGRKV